MAYQYKNYSKFVATAATATLVASVVAPMASAAFSDVSDRYTDAVSYLADKGITQGYPGGKFGTDDKIKRQDAAVMIARALGATPTGNYADAGFSDVPADRQWAVNFLAEKKIVSGKTAGQFGANDFTQRDEMAKIIANAYNFVADETNAFPFTDVSKTFKTYVDALNEAGVAQGYAGTTQFGSGDLVTRGQFALFVHRAETTAVNAEVVAVTAADAKTLEITFSAAVDAKTLKNGNANVITVTGKTGAADQGAVTQTLSADGKTLTLTAEEFFQGDYTVAVPFEVVKGTNGEFVKPVNKDINVNDQAAPVLSSVTSTVKDAKDAVTQVTLTFNENVESIENVKIAGENRTAVISGNTATISGLTLDATKSYDVTVVNAEDVVGNVKETQTATLNVVVDNIAPSITNVVATGENTLKVTVDQELASPLVVSGKIGTFNANVVSSTTVNPTNSKEYTVTLNPAYLYKNGNSDSVTLTVAKDALVDALGNKNAEVITKTAVVSKDATAPTVEKVENIVTAGKVTGFTVSYSEEVTSVNTSKIALVNALGEILSFDNVATASVSSTDSKQVVFTFKTGVTADKYGFDIAEGFVTDKSLTGNKSAQNSFSIDVKDAAAPVETAFTIDAATIANNVITVNFGEKVKATGTGSALNAASYELNGSVLPANTEVKFATTNGSIDQSKAVITLPAGFVSTNDTKAIFRVTGVQTLDNKVSNSFIASLSVQDNTAPEAKSFVATDLNEITVTYTEALATFATADVTDEVKLVDAKGASVAITAATVVDGKLVLTVADSSVVSTLTTVEASTADIKDAAGVAQKAGLTVNK